MLNLCSTCAQLITQSTQVFGYPGPITRQQRRASLFYSFYGLLLMKSKEFSFSLKIRIATNDYSPFFSSLELICVYAKMDFCYQCTMHTLVVCSLNYFHASIIFGKGGCCGFIMLGLFSSLLVCIYASNQVGFHDAIVYYLLFKPCICNQKWNWICQYYVHELTG